MHTFSIYIRVFDRGTMHSWSADNNDTERGNTAEQKVNIFRNLRFVEAQNFIEQRFEPIRVRLREATRLKYHHECTRWHANQRVATEEECQAAASSAVLAKYWARSRNHTHLVSA